MLRDDKGETALPSLLHIPVAITSTILAACTPVPPVPNTPAVFDILASVLAAITATATIAFMTDFA